jgi:hypothetical protein
MEEAFNKRRVIGGGADGELFIKPCRRARKRVVSQQDELQSCSGFLAAAVTISSPLPSTFLGQPLEAGPRNCRELRKVDLSASPSKIH